MVDSDGSHSWTSKSRSSGRLKGGGSKLVLANARLEARPWDVEQDVNGVEIPERGPEGGRAR